MPTRTSYLLLAGLSGAIVASALAAPSDVPFILCPQGPAPRVDGTLDPGEWRLAPPLSPFVLLGGREFPREQTEVRVLHDGLALYVAARLYESALDSLRTAAAQHDGPVPEDDCFHVFLDVLGDGSTYVHVAVNAAGTTFDALNRDAQEDFEWEAATGRGAGAWTAELRLPFAGGGAPPAGTQWRMSVARYQAGRDEHSSWSGHIADFHEPSRFGAIEFADRPASVITTLVDLGALALGRSAAKLAVRNEDEAEVSLKAHLRLDNPGEKAFYNYAKTTVAPGETQELTIPYVGTKDGESTLVLALADATEGRPYYRTAPFYLLVPNVGEALAAAEAALLELLREVQPLRSEPGRPDAVKSADDLYTRWQKLSAQYARRLELTPEAYAALGERADQLTTEVAAVAETAGGAPPPETIPDADRVRLTIVSPLRRVFPDERDVTGADRVQWDACRNEWVSAQVVIVPGAEDLEGVTISCGDLRSAGATIPGEDVRVYKLGWVPAKDHQDPDAESRPWPDVLRPATAGATVTADELALFWLSLRVPAVAEAATYNGVLTVAAAGGQLELPVELRVRGITLPDPWDHGFTLDMWQNWSSLLACYGEGMIEPWSEPHWQLIALYLRDLAQHGQDFATVGQSFITWTKGADGVFSFDYTIFDRYVEMCQAEGIDGGIEYLAMFDGRGPSKITFTDAASGEAQTVECNPGEPEYDTPWTAFLQDFARHLTERGWLNKTFICPTDEPQDIYGQPTLQRFAHCADLVRTAAPGLKTTAAFDSLDAARRLAPHLDRLVIKLRADVYDRQFAQEQLAANKIVEWYICYHPDAPNSFITSPLIEPRLIGWLTFREGLGGLLRWSYTAWPPDPFKQPEGDGTYAPGDLFIVYPGPRGPLSTPRWDNLRDGIEDFELLSMLKRAIELAREKGHEGVADTAQAQLDRALEAVVGAGDSLDGYTNDPDVLERNRALVVSALLTVREVADLPSE